MEYLEQIKLTLEIEQLLHSEVQKWILKDLSNEIKENHENTFCMFSL